VIIAVLAGSPAAQAQCGQDYHGVPASSSVPGGPPLAIGDSVLADAVPLLVRDGFEADGMVCRQMSQGIELLEQRARNLPHLVVLALGTNGEVTQQQIDRALAILGPTRLLALVTPHGSVVPSTPDVIRAAAASQPKRILLLEWDQLAEEHPSWLAPDGVHLGGEAGIEGYAQMIATLLPYAAPSGAGTARTETPPREPTATEAATPGEPTGAPITLAPPAPKRKQPSQAQHRPTHHEHPHAAPELAAKSHASAAAPPRVPTTNVADRSHQATSSDGSEAVIIAACAGLLVAMVALGLWRFKRS
jgi:hypothetical protein